MHTIEGIKKGREYHKKQSREGGPKDCAIDALLVEIERLQTRNEQLKQAIRDYLAWSTGDGSEDYGRKVYKNLVKAMEETDE